MATRLAYTLLALMACCHCAAQLTIEECYAKARDNYPAVKQYGLIAKTEAYNISNAAKGYLPQLALSAQATYQSDVTKLPFDEGLLAMSFKMTQEIAVKRLRDPVLLTPECESRYRRYLSGRIMPRAEQAVTSGDTGRLKELISTGMFDDASIRDLMERSLRSGKTAVTSMLMSVLCSRRG